MYESINKVKNLLKNKNYEHLSTISYYIGIIWKLMNQ